MPPIRDFIPRTKIEVQKGQDYLAFVTLYDNVLCVHTMDNAIRIAANRYQRRVGDPRRWSLV